MPYFYEMHANRLNAMGMDMLTPPMHLCRRRVRESYCTGDSMTQFFMFFFLPIMMYMLAWGVPLFLRERGTV